MNKISYFFILLLCFSFIYSKADNLRSMKTSNNFLVTKSISINAKNIPAEDYVKIRDLISKSGGTVVEKFTIKKIAMPTISFKKVKNISGSYAINGYQIDITNKYVKVKYTSKIAVKKAVDFLTSLLVTNTSGERCFQGGRFIWNDDSNKNISNSSLMATEVKEMIASFNSMAPGSTAELIVVTPTDWMVESPVITDIIGNNKLYSSKNGYIGIEQLKEVIDKAKEHDIKLSISLQLDSENQPILDFTGHSIYSVEGMRYLRAVLSEWHNKCNLENVSIKTKIDDNDTIYKRFNQFLNTIAPLVGIQINTL